MSCPHCGTNMEWEEGAGGEWCPKRCKPKRGNAMTNKYLDADGCEIQLATLFRVEPEWAASRIEYMTDRIADLEAIRDAAEKVEASGILCDPGCCGDSCGCDALHDALDAYTEKHGGE